MSLRMLLASGIVNWAGPLGLIAHHSLLLFAVVNPVGNIPVYADLTRRLETRERGHVMNLAVLTALFVVIVFALIGDWSLVYLFNVTVGELEIAGGILLFIVALRGVLARESSYGQFQDSRMLAVFPIAFPIMVGPGAITLTIITTQTVGRFPMVIAAIVTFAAVFMIARNAARLMSLMGPYVGMMIARLLYIFLAAKAVAMVLDGTGQFLRQFFPGTAGG